MSSKDTGHDLVNQIFKLEYCGLDDPGFWEWCKAPDTNERSTRCRNILHSSEDKTCVGVVQLPNKTSLKLNEKCQLGGSALKISWQNVTETLPEGKYDDIVEYCIARGNLPWWIILVVILACLIVLSISSWLFWKFYLRRRVRPTTKERKQDSMLESRFTSAPISSMSTGISGASGLGSLRTVNTADIKSSSKSQRRAKLSANNGAYSVQRSSQAPSSMDASSSTASGRKA